MKIYLALIAFVFFLFCVPATSSAGCYISKTKSAATTFSAAASGAQSLSEMPRGRGNGRGAGKAFYWGLFGIIPFVSLVAAPFAYYHGVRNATGIRKYKGAAIAGMILATFGLVLTIAMLTV